MFLIHGLIWLLCLAVAALLVKKSITINPKTDTPHFNIGGLAAALLILLFVPATLNSAFGQVPTGHRGVVLQFGAPTGEVKPEGLYTITPILQSVQLMNVQIHAHKAPASAASKDMQNVDTEITLNYRLEADAVATTYRDLGRDYEARIITPSVQEAVKAITARYDAEQLITMRTAVRDGIETMLRERLARHHILLDQLSITNFQFGKAFAEAIEAKQVALQLALKAENEVKAAKFTADSRIAQARGEAEAIRIQAEAIRSQGGAEYVQLQAIKAWHGEVPQYVSGLNAVPFINLNK